MYGTGLNGFTMMTKGNVSKRNLASNVNFSFIHVIISSINRHNGKKTKQTGAVLHSEEGEWGDRFSCASTTTLQQVTMK